MKDPDYVDPARIAKLREEQPDAGAKRARPRVRRPKSGSGLALGEASHVDITKGRVARPGVTVEAEHISITG